MRRTFLACSLTLVVAACTGQPRPPTAGVVSPSPIAATASPTPTAPSPHPAPSATSDPNANYARAQPGPIAAGAAAGSISGRVNCACDGLPAQDVYAISTDGLRFYVTQTVSWQLRFTIRGVPAGRYYVYGTERVAQETGVDPYRRDRFANGYTKAVACGLTSSCNDHSPVVVEVRAGADTAGVIPADWYSSDFPMIPTAGPPPPTMTLMPTFPTVKEAAVYVGTRATAARYVGASSQCPMNVACFWLASSQVGSGAAYFIAGAGSNDQFLSCGLYLIGGGSAWRTFDDRCWGSSVFPALGATGSVALGMGETGCVNVHASPSLGARVVACLPTGASVKVDAGPDYVPSGLPAGNDVDGESYWWHVAGRGWVVHPYLRSS